MWRWRRICFRALCTILETESLWIGTVADGSVSFDKAELISLFSAEKTYLMIRNEAVIHPVYNILYLYILEKTQVLLRPLPSSSAMPLPRISSAVSFIQQSLKNSLRTSPA